MPQAVEFHKSGKKKIQGEKARSRASSHKENH